MTTRSRELSQQITGVATLFVAPDQYLEGTLVVYLNGIRQRAGVFFQELGGQGFRTSQAPLVGDSLAVQYEVADGPPLVDGSGLEPAGA